jgi:integrase
VGAERTATPRAFPSIKKKFLPFLNSFFLPSYTQALADGLIDHNPAASLVIPRTAKTLPKAVMTKDEMRRALSALDLRERTVFGLAVLAGLRPGEILALRWGQVGPGVLRIEERVYRGVADTPKSDRGRRQAAVPPGLAADLERVGILRSCHSCWRDPTLAGGRKSGGPTHWSFACINPVTGRPAGLYTWLARGLMGAVHTGNTPPAFRR